MPSGKEYTAICIYNLNKTAEKSLKYLNFDVNILYNVLGHIGFPP